MRWSHEGFHWKIFSRCVPELQSVLVNVHKISNEKQRKRKTIFFTLYVIMLKT